MPNRVLAKRSLTPPLTVYRFSPWVSLLFRLPDDADHGGAVPVCRHTSEGSQPGSNHDHDGLHLGHRAVVASVVCHLPLQV